MPTVAETQNAETELATGLQSGVETLSLQQTVTFNLYVKMVLPLDGFVFWVRASLVNESALYNAMRFNSVPYNSIARVHANDLPAQSIVVKGSLHYATENRQTEDASQGINHVIFTAESEVNDLNAVGNTLMYISQFEGLRFAFNNRAKFYRQAGLWHYRGDAVYPTMQTQVIDSLAGLDTANAVVSNSLPIWLALDRYMPVYPSYLVDANTPPPYAAVHIDPKTTDALQAAPYLDNDFSQWQLVQETVKLDIWGFRNVNVLDYIKYLSDDSLARPDVWGLMSIPVTQDEKVMQSELNVIGQRKTVTLQVNYYQSRIRELVRQLIRQAFITVNLPETHNSAVVSS